VKFLLASASPRRADLLRQAGYAFDVVPADVDEEQYTDRFPPRELASFLARTKAREVARRKIMELLEVNTLHGEGGAGAGVGMGATTGGAGAGIGATTGGAGAGAGVVGIVPKFWGGVLIKVMVGDSSL